MSENIIITKSKKKCFIITPIGDNNDPIRRKIDGVIDECINPALGETYEIIVSHRINISGRMDKQIIEGIYTADLIIVNLTNLNPNVMYELAFADTIGKNVILIAEEGTKLPFDITSQRTNFYKDDLVGGRKLRDDIINLEKNLNEKNVSNPIYDIIKNYELNKKLIEKVENQGTTEDANMLKILLNKTDNIGKKLNMQKQKENTSRALLKIELFNISTLPEADIRFVKEEILKAIQNRKEYISQSWYSGCTYGATDNFMNITFDGYWISNQARKYLVEEVKEIIINVLKKNNHNFICEIKDDIVW